MKYTITFIALAIMLLLFACKKEQTPTTGTISGNLSSYDPATPLVKTPVEGVKLWLMKADFKFDTVTFAGNRAAIVDSSFSDSKGNYHFSNIAFGNYYVSPIPDSAGYRFAPVPVENTAPLAISEAAPNQNLSFSSPFPGGENYQFAITLKVYKNGNNIPYYYKLRRQHWFLFIPYFVTIQDGQADRKFFLPTEPDVTTGNFNYGYFYFFLTMSNNFLFDFYNFNNELVDSYWIVQDLGNTPSASTWEIDLSAHSITRTSP